MQIPLYLWILLVIIGVFDSRECRIPNYLIVSILVVCFFNLLYFNDGIIVSEVSEKLFGFAISFTIFLIFYMLKIMTAGDVKLIAVIGFIIGYTRLIEYVQYLSVSCLFIGTMYWMLNHLQVTYASKDIQRNGLQRLSYFVVFVVEGTQIKNDIISGRNITYMPLAPVLIVALAMQQYFH